MHVLAKCVAAALDVQPEIGSKRDPDHFWVKEWLSQLYAVGHRYLVLTLECLFV